MGPGTVLGGRYAVHRRLEQRRDVERWSADDTTLGRTVSVLVIGSDDHRTAALLDAARRAASVSHAVFARILDVGTDEEVAYVVEEDLSSARTLTDLVTDGGVPGDEVRRITGEVAAALEAARQRGMHHLELEPDDVLRTHEGDVRLRGLETAAVRAGHEGAEADEAARRDAVGVVALAYAGLTGLWPLGSGGSGLGAAPRVPGGVAAPSEIAAGVPRDLDAICRLTINDDQGPTSPGDYARQVAPWPSRQVVGRPVVPAVTPPRPEGLDAPSSDDDAAPVEDEAPATEALPADDLEDTRPRPRVGGAAAAALGGAALGGAVGGAIGAAGSGAPDTTHELPRLTPASDRPLTPDDDGGVDDVFGADGDGHGGRDAAAAAFDDTDDPDDADDEGFEATRVIALPTPPPPPPPLARAGRDEDLDDPRDTDDERWDDSDDDDDSTGEGRGAAAAAGAAAAGAAVAGALGSVGERVGSLARRAVDKVSELSPDTTAGPGAGDLEAPAPLVPSEPLTKDESKLALAIVVVFLVAALVIGIWGVTRIGANTDLQIGSGNGPATRTTTVPPSSGTPSQGSSEAPSGAAEPLAILKVEAYDPGGDGAENNSSTPKTYDGNPSTGWSSENYRSDQFGGLKKGLGVIVDLGPNKKPQGIELTIPVAADIEVYVGPDNRLEGATKVGEKADAKGTVTFQVPADVSGQYIVVWYTKLTADDRGKRRASLNEVVVTG
ncbi:hypothetical protein [Oryzobacter telluris]|uniref:hypothetical protein n=1 Tax=Oryzobacter telluris TaxID=3149179 RepID=UPI00370DE186